MNKIINCSLFVLLITLLFQSCQKDMQDEINNGGWNHERSILSIKFKNQVGAADITRMDEVAGEIMVTLNVDAIPDLSKVEIESLVLSYQAQSSASKGSTLNFSNPERKTSLTVTSATGEKREYAIYATEFTETITGTWSINNLVVYGGTGPEWGGGAVLPLQDKSWCWYDDYAPGTECDNTLVFTMDGITDDGNTSGVCINNAGADGKYANFIFKASSNPETGVDVDLKHFYRQIPEGESRWVRNYSAGTITFTDKNGQETIGALDNAGTYDLGYGQSVSIINNAFSFVLNGQDDWSNIFSDYDKFAKKPRKYFIMVTKIN